VEQILKEANQKGAEIAEKAQRNADFLKNEIEHKIDERAKEKVNDLVQKVIPKDFLEDVHRRWVDESDKGAFNLKNLKLPEKVNEAKIVSANDNATIIAVKIFDAADGLRPNELMLAKALAAKTAQGPNMQAMNINVRATLRSILNPYSTTTIILLCSTFTIPLSMGNKFPSTSISPLSNLLIMRLW